MMAGGAGTILHMITSLRNNNRMVRRSKRRIFDKRGYFEPDTTSASAQSTLDLRPASDAELAIARNVALKNRKRGDRLAVILVVLCIGALISLLALAFKPVHWPDIYIKPELAHHTTQKEVASVPFAASPEEAAEKLDKYQFYIADGDAWLSQMHFHNAIFQYKMALRMLPGNTKAQQKLDFAQEMRCFYEPARCALSR